MTETSAPIESEEHVPRFLFSTEDVSEKEQFPAWRDFCSSLSEIKSIAPSESGFRAHVDAYDMGALQLTSFHIPPVTFTYSKEHTRKFGVDHWCLSTLKRGNMVYTAEGHDLRTGPGSLYLQSYTTPFSGMMDGTDITSLFLSRDEFWDLAGELDGGANQYVTGPMSLILKEFLFSVEKQADRLTKTEGSAVNEAFSHLLKAAFRQNRDTVDAAKSPIAATQFSMARRFINENLKSPNLTPDVICFNLGISRRQLYYIFEKHGGVKKYITLRRLAACYSALTNGNEKKLISSIAYEYGFTNLSSFYRQFHGRYGFRPSDARGAWLNGHKPSETAADTFADWLLRNDDV